MSVITTLPDRLCEWFSDMNEFSSCAFTTQFPPESKITPLDKPVVVFGTGKINVLENTADETGTAVTDSRVCEEEFTVGIHAPRTLGGAECSSLLDRVIDLILFDTSLNISSIKSEEPQYIRNTDSIYLQATFMLSDTLRKGTGYPTALTL